MPKWGNAISPAFIIIFISFLGTIRLLRASLGIGVLAGILMAVHQAKVTGENPDTIWDFAIYAVIFSVIGARIYYVVFAWDYYKDNLLSIFNTRNGGMAIYGGKTVRIFPEYFTVHKVTPAADDLSQDQPRHTFLYESLWNLMILIIMLVYRKHKKFEGEICLSEISRLRTASIGSRMARKLSVYSPNTSRFIKLPQRPMIRS